MHTSTGFCSSISFFNFWDKHQTKREIPIEIPEPKNGSPLNLVTKYSPPLQIDPGSTTLPFEFLTSKFKLVSTINPVYISNPRHIFGSNLTRSA